MNLKNLSELVKVERVKRGVSLEKISEDTKIPIKFLEYIEEEKWENFPNDVYKKAVLKKYLNYLKIEFDVENLFNKNEEFRKDEEEIEEKITRTFDIKLNKILFVIVLFCVFLILFVITNFYLIALLK